jgi:hypothetical protein
MAKSRITKKVKSEGGKGKIKKKLSLLKTFPSCMS